MASLANAALCALVGAAFWSLVGYVLGRHVLPRALALGMAPVLGWAVHSAAALPIFSLIGFAPWSVFSVDGLSALTAAAVLVLLRPKADAARVPVIPAWAYAAAAVLALVPAAAIAPKFAAGAVYLSGPIFDHSKIAIIDAMTRQGLPPVNPVFGEFGTAGRLAYYYLWHFSAAELALALHTSGWEADIALTWFTALASLTLMMALAVWLGNTRWAAIVVVGLAAAASSRGGLAWIVGVRDLKPFLHGASGFAGWLFQSAWVPQHLMSASCVVAAMLLITRYAERPSLALLLTLVLTVAAGFESSSYVGGITFAMAALAAAPLLLAWTEPARRLRFAAAMATAALLVGLLIAPFAISQVAAVAARHDPAPVVIHPFSVLGPMFPYRLRRLLDLPAYWLVELPVELPAIYLPGALAFFMLLRSVLPRPQKTAIAALACLAGAGLAASWLLASTLGDNNDLALRAVLPAAMALIVATAVGLACARGRALIGATALAGLLLSLPDSVYLVHSDLAGRRVAEAKIFARTPELWRAVRRHASPTARVANDPLFLQDLTPWPVNISWALLADRSACFAGRELALALVPLPAARREAINAQFIRVFAGEGTAEDIGDMASKYGCDVVVLVPQDKAWTKDPFALSPDYRLAESRADRWRIYIRTTADGRGGNPAPGGK
jgi:hypothetical protein